MTQKCTCLDFKWQIEAKIKFARKKNLFLVNLTEREHSQDQTWGETVVTVGIEDGEEKKKKNKNTSLYPHSTESTTNQTENFSHFVSGANIDNDNEWNQSPFSHWVKTSIKRHLLDSWQCHLTYLQYILRGGSISVSAQNEVGELIKLHQWSFHCYI